MESLLIRMGVLPFVQFSFVSSKETLTVLFFLLVSYSLYVRLELRFSMLFVQFAYSVKSHCYRPTCPHAPQLRVYVYQCRVTSEKGRQFPARMQYANAVPEECKNPTLQSAKKEEKKQAHLLRSKIHLLCGTLGLSQVAQTRIMFPTRDKASTKACALGIPLSNSPRQKNTPPSALIYSRPSNLDSSFSPFVLFSQSLQSACSLQAHAAKKTRRKKRVTFVKEKEKSGRTVRLLLRL